MTDNITAPIAGKTFKTKDTGTNGHLPGHVLYDEAEAEVLGKVTASPTANTVLGRLKDILSLVVLAAGSNIIGKVGIDQTTPGTTNAVVASGDVASGSSDSGNPVKAGAKAITALPTAVSDGQRVNRTADKFGRAIVTPVTIRDLVGTQTTTISASTSETTIVTAGASGVFNDLVMLVISNTSASTNTRIDFRDATGGSVLFSLQSNGGQPPVGFALTVPVPQTTAANNWTAQCATSTSDVRIYAVFAKQK